MLLRVRYSLLTFTQESCNITIFVKAASYIMDDASLGLIHAHRRKLCQSKRTTYVRHELVFRRFSKRNYTTSHGNVQRATQELDDGHSMSL
jgi:hypothetical protein